MALQQQMAYHAVPLSCYGTKVALAMVWRPALAAVWFDSTLCLGGCQRVIRKSKKKDCNINEVVIAISHPDQWGFGSG
jgi:hypothetical protein